jgi:hypothetical protein
VSRWLTLAALMAAAAAPVLGIQAGASSGTARLVLLACTAVAAALSVGIATLQRLESQGRQQEAEEAAAISREDSLLALGGALGPTTQYLAALAAARTDGERRTLLGQLVQALLSAAVVVGPEGTRSVLYLAAPDDRCLRRSAWSGRSGAPREVFRGGTSAGDFALDLLRSRRAHLVPDVRGDPHVQPSIPGSYDAAAVAVVTAGPRTLGLLTADAPGVASLTAVELGLLQVLADLVGAGLAVVPGVAWTAEEER